MMLGRNAFGHRQSPSSRQGAASPIHGELGSRAKEDSHSLDQPENPDWAQFRAGKGSRSAHVVPRATPLEVLRQENELLKQTIAEGSEAVQALEGALAGAGAR